MVSPQQAKGVSAPARSPLDHLLPENGCSPEVAEAVLAWAKYASS